MDIQIKTSSGITLCSIGSCLLNERKIFIEGEIDAAVACEFVKEAMLLTRQDAKKPIDVLINSPGGEIVSGMLIYDCIQSSATPIRIFCVGMAYSMAAVLLASGKQRFILPSSKLMLHEPLLGSKVSGNSSSIKSISDSLLASRKQMNELLAKHTGKTEKEIEEATSYDHYFTAEEAIDFGLCDEIISFAKIMEE